MASPTPGQQVEQARLGARAYAFKRKASPKVWKNLVSIAHKKGFSVDDFLDNTTPDPLKPRTQQSLRDQAQKTVTSSYAPDTASLSARDKQIRAIDSSRALADQQYTSWLTARAGELQTHAAAADQAMQSAATALQQGTINAVQGLGAQVQSHADAMNPGNVSAGQTDQNVAGQVAAEGSRDIQTVGAALGTLNNYAGSEAQHQADMSNSNMAQMAALDASRQSDTWKALTNLASDRDALKLKEAGDIQGEVSRLLDNEQSKANQNREYATAVAGLNIRGQQLNLNAQTEQDQNTQATNRNNIAGQNADTAATVAKNNAQHQRNMESLQNTRNQISQGQLDVAWYRARHPAKAGKKGGTGGSDANNDPQTRFDQAYAALSSPRTARGQNAQGNPIPYDVNYVRANQNAVVNDLVHGLKLTPEMARRVVRAYLAHNGGGGDPGHYTGYAGAGSVTGQDPKPSSQPAAPSPTTPQPGY